MGLANLKLADINYLLFIEHLRQEPEFFHETQNFSSLSASLGISTHYKHSTYPSLNNVRIRKVYI